MSIGQIIILSIIGLAGGGIILQNMSDNMKMQLLLVQFYLIYSGCLN